MINISLAECARTLQVPYTGPHVLLNSISIDTRTLQEGALFIAIRGEYSDGHDFIPIAAQKKAGAIISTWPISTNIPFLQVRDTRVALGLLGKHHRQKFSVPTIAITGSCGKTTTKEYLRNIFDQSYNSLASIRSFNNVLGVPLTLLALDASHNFLIVEMGANQAGSIAWLSRLTQPTIGVIVNVEPAHLKGFGSIDNIAQAKAEIFQGLQPTGIAILPMNFLKHWPQYVPNHPRLLFGAAPSADVYAKEVHINSFGYASFILGFQKKEVEIQLPFPGRHQVNNALAAAAAALASRIALDQIKIGLETATVTAHRLNIITTIQYGTILDDTYNATPTAVYAALEVLSRYAGKRVFIFADMQELGKMSDYYHRLVGKWARALGVHQLFTIGRYSKITSQCFGKGSEHISWRIPLIHRVKEALDTDCITLIKGSRAMQMEQVVAALLSN